ncbi:MAG: glycosyltransferase family 4 protein [Planctomycetota bacterium]
MIKKKSVLLIGNYPPPFGGVPRHIEYLVPDLVAGGYEVHVLSGGHTGIEKRPGYTVYKFNRQDRFRALLKDWNKNLYVWQRYFQTFGWSFHQVSYFLSLISLGRQIIRQYDVSIIKAYNLSSYAPIGAVLSSELNLPLVVSNFGEYYSNPEFFRKHIALVQFVAKQATRRLSMTQHCAAIYKKFGVDLPCEIVHYGIDLKLFEPRNTGHALLQELGIKPEEKMILFLARMTREMGLDVFIAAVKNLLRQSPGLKIIIGGKPEELLGKALKLQAEYPGNVFVRPNIPNADLPHYYGAATVVAVPTLGDRAGGSLSAAEASATAKPVVASRVGGVPEFVVDGQTGLLVPPGDPDALAAALWQVCSDENLAHQMGSAGRAFAESNFDKAHTNKRILEIFNEILF